MELLIVAIVGVIVWLLVEGSHTSPSPSTDSSTGNNNLQNIAQAIFQFEGNGQPGATNSWNNNPGNVGGGQATYSTIGDGWQSLYNTITSQASAHPDWTFNDFFQNYLGQPGNPNATDQGNPTTYAQYVADYVGVDPNQNLNDFLNGGS